MTLAPDTFDVLCSKIRGIRRRRSVSRPSAKIGALDRPATSPSLRLIPPVDTPSVMTVPPWLASELIPMGRLHPLIPLANYLIVGGLAFLSYQLIHNALVDMLDAGIARSSMLFAYILSRVSLVSEWIAGVIAVVAWIAVSGMLTQRYRDGRNLAWEFRTSEWTRPRPVDPVPRMYFGIAAVFVILGFLFVNNALPDLLLAAMTGTPIVFGYKVALLYMRLITIVVAFVAWIVLSRYLSRRYREDRARSHGRL